MKNSCSRALLLSFFLYKYMDFICVVKCEFGNIPLISSISMTIDYAYKLFSLQCVSKTLHSIVHIHGYQFLGIKKNSSND